MEMLFTLAGDGTLTDRLYRQLREAIVQGRVGTGTALPSSRELARQLQVSRSTVALVYERLNAEGHTLARVGAGTFVAEGIVVDRARRSRARPRSVASTGPDLGERPQHSFRLGVPDASLFPVDAWRRHYIDELRRVEMHHEEYPDPLGYQGLRRAISNHIAIGRSVMSHPDGVLVTAGAQQAIALLAGTLLREGAVASMEDPGYPAVRQVLAATGARIASMAVDDEGADPSTLPDDTKLVYVTPSHQFPTGVVMSHRRRLQLLHWAVEHDAIVVEDDYDSEYRFHDRPLEPLHSLDDKGVVAYVGTFSKALLPSLRVGYVVPPDWLLPRLLDARRLADSHGDTITQAALARLMESGEFATHIRRARRTYRARYQLLKHRLGEAPFVELLRVFPSSAGLHLAVEFRDQTPGVADRVVRAAHALGLAVRPLSAFGTRHRREGLVLGFGDLALEQLDPAIDLLAQAVTDDDGRLAR